MRACDICRELYWPVGRDALQVCEGCRPNLAALEPLTGREVLDEALVQRLLAEQALEAPARPGAPARQTGAGE